MDETKRIEFSDRLYKLTMAVVILVAVVFLGNLMYSFQTLPQNYPQQISVSGEGKVYAKPDVAVLVLGVESRGAKISDISKDNTDKMNKIIKDVKDLGVAEKDIQTTQYTITPEYNWTERGGRIFTGYVLNQQITVKARDFDKVGSILDKATSDGANAVGDLRFEVDNPEQIKAQARKEAIAQAKTKAQTMANQSGLHLAKLLNISEGYQASPMPLYESAKAVGMGGADSSSAPDIQPGQLQYNLTVTLTYRLR